MLCGVQYLLRRDQYQQEHVTHALPIQCLVAPFEPAAVGRRGRKSWCGSGTACCLELVAAMAWVLGQRWRRWRADPVAETRLACPHRTSGC